MSNKKSYVPRLILFGNKFQHDVLGMLGLMAEEYDLINGDFGEMIEADILLQYVTRFKGIYSKAMIVYCYDKKGLVFHHMFDEGPCFEIKCMEDVKKLLSISELICMTSLLSDLAIDYEVAGNQICTLVNALPKSKNKANLQGNYQSALTAQDAFFKNAKLILEEYMTSNFAV